MRPQRDTIRIRARFPGGVLCLLSGIAAILAAIGTFDAFRGAKAWLVALAAAVAVLLLAAPRHLGGRSLERIARGVDRLGLPALLLLAFTLRMVWVALADTIPVSDYLRYHELADNLVTGGYYGIDGRSWAYRPPGWPFVLSLVYRLGADPVFGAGVLNALFSTLTLPAVYLLARAAGGSAVARRAALFWAILPSQVLIASLAGTEPLFTLLLAWSAVLALDLVRSGPDRTPRPMLVRGLLLGLAAAAATYVRGTGLLVPGALLGGAVLFGPRRPAVLGALAVAGVVTVAALIPWGLRNQRVLGEFVLLTTNSGPTLYQANQDWATGAYVPPEKRPDLFRGLSETERNRRARDEAVRWIRANPARFLGLVPRKWAGLLGNDLDIVAIATNQLGAAWLKAPLRGLCQVGYLALLLLAVPGALALARRSPPLTLVLASLIALWFLIHAIYHGQPRFHVAILPFFSVLAALGTRLARSHPPAPPPDVLS